MVDRVKALSEKLAKERKKNAALIRRIKFLEEKLKEAGIDA